MSYTFHPLAVILRKPTQQGRRGQGGFTLIELMVSITLGLLIVVALAAVYLNISRTNTEMAKTNGLIENGRFSMDLLEEDISHAGFWGGYVPKFDDTTYTAAAPGDAPTDYAATLPSPPDPCLAYASWAGTAGYTTALIGLPVQAYTASPSANCTTLLGADIAADKQANTDVLIVRHADNCLPGVGSCDADTIANAIPKVYFQSSYCSQETENTPPYRFVLSNTAADFTLKKRGCTGTPPATAGTASDRRKYVSNMYFVRNYAVTSGDGIPTLMRSTFGIKADGTAPAYETPVSLVEGVQGFTVEIGVDAVARCGANADTAVLSLVDPTTCAVNAATAASNTLPVNRGDGVPESFVRCTTASPCTNAQLQNATAVKVWVLVRSRESTPTLTDDKVYCLGTSCGTPTVTACPTGTTNAAPLYGPFCDGYKRHVFQTTVRLTNVSGRRETP